MKSSWGYSFIFFLQTSRQYEFTKQRNQIFNSVRVSWWWMFSTNIFSVFLHSHHKFYISIINCLLALESRECQIWKVSRAICMLNSMCLNVLLHYNKLICGESSMTKWIFQQKQNLSQFPQTFPLFGNMLAAWY